MSKIYLVNIGANTAHGTSARSPIFADGRFVFVSFPTTKEPGGSGYSDEAFKFVRSVDRQATHADPDWIKMTYGDNLLNPRATSLRNACIGDVLLFWGLLWENNGHDWSGFTGNKGWYLVGAIRIAKIVSSNSIISSGLTGDEHKRMLANAHIDSSGNLEPGNCIFIGHPDASAIFEKAVSLGADRPDGLMYKAFTTADGKLLQPNTRPHWSSSLRSCRPVWCLDDPSQRKRAVVVRDAIRRLNTEFDLLVGY